MTFRVAEAERQAGDLVRFGIIAEVDLDAGRVVVAFGDLLSPPLPWLCPRAAVAGEDDAEGTAPAVVWDPPAKGEQVMVLAAEADLSAGLVLAGVPSDSVLDQLGDARGRDVFFRRFRDGSTVLYDPDASELAVELVEPGKVRLVAKGGVEIEGDVKITGKLETTDDVTIGGQVDAAKDVKVAGEVQAEKDVKAKTVSLVDHMHLGVQTGPGVTGKPRP